ncbi:uncharacterized protein LOC108675526 [Hyalella azteca]|uniref:dolichyl-phosphate-mannose--protein mannosyltransferase n=1 Tax=Hyalella azteca TaxID=294128 RepID=A0A979FUY6_HYAAZ|nr:uncharacterized protein LOC108675526 [Hyalella azteca]
MASSRFTNERTKCLKLHCVVLLSSVAVYLNGLFGDYVHDDISVIVQNRDVQGTTPLMHVFVNDYWGRRLDHPLSHKSYRPLVILSFRLERWLLGRSEPRLSHAVNLLLHCAVVCLYTHVLLRVLMLPSTAVLLSALLFSVHPVHTEAVTGVVGRADVAAAFAFLACFLAYHKAIERHKRFCDRAAASDRQPRQASLMWSYFWAVLGVLCKEQAITALAVCIVWDVCLTYRRLLGGRVLDEIRALLTGVVVIRVTMMGSRPLFSEQDNPASFSTSATTRYCSLQVLLTPAQNCWLLLCPSSLSCDWQLGSVPLLRHPWSDARVLASLALGVVLLLLLKRAIQDLCTEEGRALLWSLAVMLCSFLPASNLFFPVGFVLAERLLYIPSLGYCTIVGMGMTRLLFYGRPSDGKKNGQTFEVHKRTGGKLPASRLCTSSGGAKDLATEEGSGNNGKSRSCLNNGLWRPLSIRHCTEKKICLCGLKQNSNTTIRVCEETLDKTTEKPLSRLSLLEKYAFRDSSGYSSAHSSCGSTNNHSPISSPYSSPLEASTRPPAVVCHQITKTLLDGTHSRIANLETSHLSNNFSASQVAASNISQSLSAYLKEALRKNDGKFGSSVNGVRNWKNLSDIGNKTKYHEEPNKNFGETSTYYALTSMSDRASYQLRMDSSTKKSFAVSSHDGDSNLSSKRSHQCLAYDTNFRERQCKQLCSKTKKQRLGNVVYKEFSCRNEALNHTKHICSITSSASRIKRRKFELSKEKNSSYLQLNLKNYFSFTFTHNFARRLGQLCLVATFFFFVHKCVLRNFDWTSRETLLRSGLAVLPHNAKFHYNYGNLMRERHDYDQAVHHYTQAIRLWPQYPSCGHSTPVPNTLCCARLWPQYPSARNNLAAVLVLQGKLPQAEQQLQMVVQQFPVHQNAALNLAKLYARKQWYEAARRVLENAFRVDAVFRDPSISEQMEHLLSSLQQHDQKIQLDEHRTTSTRNMELNTKNSEKGLEKYYVYTKTSVLGTCDLVFESSINFENSHSCDRNSPTLFRVSGTKEKMASAIKAPVLLFQRSSHLRWGSQ